MGLKASTVYCLYRGGYAFSFALMATIFSLYHIEAGLDPLQLIIVGAVLEASCFLLEIPTGVVADMFSRKRSLVIGLVVMGLGLAFEGLFPYFVTILLAQVIWGAGATFLSGADVAWLSDELEEGAGLNTELLRGTRYGQLGSIFGIVTSVLLARVGLYLPIVLSGCGLLILAVILWRIMPEHRWQRPAPQTRIIGPYLEQIRLGAVHLRTGSGLLMLVAVIWMGGLFQEGIDRLWVLHLVEGAGHQVLSGSENLYWFALIQIVLLALNFGVMRLLEPRIEGMSRAGLFAVMAGNNLVLLVALWLFATVGSFPLVLGAYWLLMVARGTNEPLATMLVNDTITESEIRATVLSMKGLADQIGQIVGGLIVGMIALRAGVGHALQLSCLVVIPIILLLLRLKQRAV